MHRLGGLLIQALDPDRAVGVDDRARAGLREQRGVLTDAVEGLGLEAPPVGPHGRGGVGRGEAVGDLVGVGGVVKAADLEAVGGREVEHDDHLIGAIAVVVHEDLAAQHLGQSLEREVPRRRLRLLGRPALLAVTFARGLRLRLLGCPFGQVLVILLPAALVLAGLLERLAVAGDVAHAGLRAGLLPVDPLGVLAASELDALGCAGEARLGRAARARMQAHGEGAPAEQVGRAGQDLHGRDTAGARAIDLRVLREVGVGGPDTGGVGRDRLVAVGVRGQARRGVDADMRVGVDDAGGQGLAGELDDGGALGHREVLPDRDDLAVLDQEVGARVALAGRGHDLGAAQEGLVARTARRLGLRGGLRRGR